MWGPPQSFEIMLCAPGLMGTEASLRGMVVVVVAVSRTTPEAPILPPRRPLLKRRS